MDATAWLARNAEARIPHSSFACLEGCGFCCTYPPEVSEEEMARVEQATGLTSPATSPSGTDRLPLQGECGACALLEDRRCTAYDERPMHCRLFPFHVYLGRTVEIYADRVCPGLDPDIDQLGEPARQATPHEIDQAIEAAMEAAWLERLQAMHEESLRVHAEFEKIAREEGVWADPEAAIEAAREQASVTPEAWNTALDTFRADDPAADPAMVLPGKDFEWRAWHLEDATFTRYRFTETGEREVVGQTSVPSGDEEAGPACRDVLEQLASYECFAGMVFDRVDAARYEVPLSDAAQAEADDVLAELAVRAHLLEAEGVPVNQRWLSAAYEPAFYDPLTIGAWL